MAKAKKLMDRFTRQATRIVGSTKGTELQKPRAGETAKQAGERASKEIGRRALNQAKRHQSRAKDRASKNVNVRAQASRVTVIGTTKKAKIATGKALRTARTRSGSNLITGEKQSALKTGRKAIKRSLRKGSVKGKQGSKALAQLAAMDPTTRRDVIKSTGGRSADKSTNFKGGLKNRQGQDLSLLLKGLRQKAKTKVKAKTATPRRDPRTGAR